MSSDESFPQHIIAKKRDGQVLTREDIFYFVRGATDGSWAPYQLSALLMAIFIRGMNPEETAALTEAMMRSGVIADLSSVSGFKLDKHSTGGVGDKVSIPLAPMVTACGLPVPMISGRGLGHSGGTLDKLESIPGFRTNLSLEQYRQQVEKVGCALIGQTRDLAPADKTLYSLRDVTATVECIPLICASILSKKLAEGIDGLVLDVKFGSGAFMKTHSEAQRLAEALVSVGRAGGKKVRALITAMEEPLGRCVGNATEVRESIECLRGHGPADLMEVTYALGAHMLLLGGAARTEEEAKEKLQKSISSGAALKKFREIVAAQGGEVAVFDDPAALPQAEQQIPLKAARAGYITRVDAMGIALAALHLGAGRARAEDTVDPAVGVTALVKVGEQVKAGDTLCVLHANRGKGVADAQAQALAAITISDHHQPPVPLIADVII
ncbi:MAG TPA: thymidine phosphorylase [Opitutaceae bacterium]|nr:thymidine phosphorylase [Opitutaceae bacterium]